MPLRLSIPLGRVHRSAEHLGEFSRFGLSSNRACVDAMSVMSTSLAPSARSSYQRISSISVASPASAT